jgi:cyclopropane fatty-acyl-phospholipid synthase-like methyltransferase
VMDFGCGTGHIAETLAQRVSEVAVWDASHAVRARTGKRLAGHPNISFLDLNDDIGTQRAGRFDLILSHSVVQYMTHAEFARWLCTWASMLTTNGAIVLSDVVTDGRTTARELFDLAVFATRHHALLGTLLDELSSVLRYAHTRANASLLTLRPGELTALAHEQGLQLEVLPANLGHKTGRLAVVLS